MLKKEDRGDTVEAVICTQPESPRFDAIPTYKITCYPLEKRAYKPFAQAQVCVTPRELAVRLWAFEALPRPASMVEAVFTPREGAALLRIRAWADGRWECRLFVPEGPREGKPLDAIAHTMAGDDFQGEYWGISVGIPRQAAEEALGLALEPGARLLGNFYKRSRDPEKPHDGSCWPADFAGGREYALGSLAGFTVVTY